MLDRKNTPIAVKSKALALEIIKLCTILRYDYHEYVLCDQLLRSGTSVGANIREAFHGSTNRDMLNKFYIALKEASETEYWLELLVESNKVPNDRIRAAYSLCQECLKMLVVITKNSKLQNN